MKLLLFALFALLLVGMLLFSTKARRFVYDCGYALSQMLFRLQARQGLILGAYSVPEGSRFFFSSTFAAAKAITALSNANPARATSTAHGFVDGNEVLNNLGWEDANGVWQVDQFDANSFDILGLDSTNTTFFPSGSGTGTAQLVTNWVEIPQVLTISTTGGDPRYTPIQPLARRNAIQMAIGFNPSSIELGIGWDPSLAAFKSLVAVSRTLTKVALKMTISGGGTAYAYGTLAVSEVPTMTSGQVNTSRVAMAVDGRLVTY